MESKPRVENCSGFELGQILHLTAVSVALRIISPTRTLSTVLSSHVGEKGFNFFSFLL